MALRVAVCVSLAALLMPCSGSTEGVHCEGSVCQLEADQDAVSALQFNLSRAQLGAERRADALCPDGAKCPRDEDCEAQGAEDCGCVTGHARKGAHVDGRDEDCDCPEGVTTNAALWREAKARRGTHTTCRLECGDGACTDFLEHFPAEGPPGTMIDSGTEFLCVEPPPGICVTKLCVRAGPEKPPADVMHTGQICEGNSCAFHSAVPGKVCVETCSNVLRKAKLVKHFVATWEYCSSKLPAQRKKSQATGRPWFPAKRRGGHGKGPGTQIVTVKATMGADGGGYHGAYAPASYTYQDTGAQKYS